MKKRAALFALYAMLHAACIAQSSRPNDAPVYDILDENPDLEMPQFPGGETALLRYLSKSIQYPALARKNNIQGTVLLTFVVERDGTISNPAIVEDIGGGCGAEALRAVGGMPDWRPGKVDGQSVRVRFTLPVKFKLEEPESKKEKKKKWWQRDALFGN